MNLYAIAQSQILDPFRIALLIGLVITMSNTRAATGFLIPALAGIVFVAAIIPMTLQTGQPFWPQFGVGIAVNAILLAVILGAMRLLRRLRG